MKSSNSLYSRARNSFYDQLKRCQNPKNPLFKWYGEKGISVKYSLDDFLGWYYENAKGFKRPTVDRIDHSKDYCFENIQIVEKSENSKERIRRLGTPIPRRPVIMISGNIIIKEYESAYHAVRDNQGMVVSGVHRCCTGERMSHKGFSFRYKE